MKNTQINLRLSPEENYLLEELSAVTGKTKSEILRESMYFYAKNLSIVSFKVNKDGLKHIEKLMENI